MCHELPLAARAPEASPIPVRPRDRSWAALVWYEAVRWAALVYCLVAGGLRVTGRARVPRVGGALVVANHASFLDVFVLGVAVPRPLNYVARATLFVPVLGFLIRSLNGFPIDREGGGLAGLKEAFRRVRAGALVLIFPEGTRTADGQVAPLQPGFAAMARARVPIVPVGVAGTFEAWPRHCAAPRPHPVRVHIGEPIPPETMEALDPPALIELVRERLLAAHCCARTGLARDRGRSG